MNYFKNITSYFSLDYDPLEDNGLLKSTNRLFKSLGIPEFCVVKTGAHTNWYSNENTFYIDVKTADELHNTKKISNKKIKQIIMGQEYFFVIDVKKNNFMSLSHINEDNRDKFIKELNENRNLSEILSEDSLENHGILITSHLVNTNQIDSSNLIIHYDDFNRSIPDRFTEQHIYLYIHDTILSIDNGSIYLSFATIYTLK